MEYLLGVGIAGVLICGVFVVCKKSYRDRKKEHYEMLKRIRSWDLLDEQHRKDEPNNIVD